MVSRLFRLLNRDMTTMNQAALVLAVFSVLSQIFGLLRDRLLASFVGPSATLDVYYASFRIPDFIYNSIGAIFSVTVIIPFVTALLKDDNNSGEFKRFYNSIFSVYCLGMIIVSVVIALFMPYLTHLTAPGFSSIQQEQLITFSRIMLFSPILMGLASLLGSFAQVQKKFLSFALAPLFYNFGILLGIIFLLPRLGIKGVVFGVVVGAVLYLLIQLPTLFALHKFPNFTKAIDWQVIKNIIRLSLPRVVGLSLNHVTFIIISSIASMLVIGSISIFQFSYNIETTPLLIIGVSYAVAAFPTLSRLNLEGKKQEFLDIIYRATRNIFFLSIPLALFIIVLRAHVVRVLLGSGVFSWNNTKLVAASLALFAVSITAQCMIMLLVRGFYALGNTKTPLKINALSVLITTVSVVLLLFLYRYNSIFSGFLEDLLHIESISGSNVVLLSLAYSIGQITNAVLLWKYFHRHIPKDKAKNVEMHRSLWHIVASGMIASAVVYLSLNLLGGHVDQKHFWGIFWQAAISTVAGTITYGLLLIALKNDDVALFIGTLRSKFWRAKPIVPEQQDL